MSLPEGKESEQPGDQTGGRSSSKAVSPPHAQVMNSRQSGRQARHWGDEYKR